MAEALTKTGRYQIVSELGRGSMGVVYQGFDPVIGRTVAIKTMLVEGLPPSEFEEYKARFQREAQSAGVLTHPNIVTVYDFGEDSGVLYLAMEFLEGRSIQQLVDQHNVLPVETILPMYEQICSALDHAHSHKIVHRDIKPANIMILDSGLVKVTDFGIAKMMSMGMTQAGQILGTPNYMSPEQVKGRQVDGRSDIFSLGVILYELVTGEKPFGGQNITTVIYKIVNENPIPPRELDATIHPGLSFVIQKSLAKSPDERYQTCRELAEDLRNYRNLGGVIAPSATLVIKVPPMQIPPPTPPETPARQTRDFQRAAEPVFEPPPEVRPSPPAVEPRYSQSTPEPRYTTPVGEVRTAAPPAPPRVQPSAPSPIDLKPAVTPPAYSAPQPKPSRSSAGPWGILVAFLILAGGGGFYYYNFIYLPGQQGRQVGPSPNPPSTNATSTAPTSNSPAASESAGANSQVTSKPAVASSQPGPAVVPPPAPASETKTTPQEVQPSATNGKLVVESNITGAAITVDGQTNPDWLTPHVFTDLAPGRHEIFVSKDGYTGTTKYANITKGRSVTTRADLGAAKPASPETTTPAAGDDGGEKGIVVVKTDPPGLEVLIDGNPQGPSPTHISLPQGKHTYSVICKGMPSPNYPLQVTAGGFSTQTVSCH